MPRSRILLRRRWGPDVDGRADGREGEPPPLEPHRGDAGQCGRHRVPVLPDHARRRREDEGPRGHPPVRHRGTPRAVALDRKSTRLNSSHGYISYAVFFFKKKTRLNSSHGYISYAVFCLKKKTKLRLYAKLIAATTSPASSDMYNQPMLVTHHTDRAQRAT